MAKKFLYFIAFCIVAILLAGIAYQMFRDEIFAAAFVPSAEFVEQEPLSDSAYEDPALWLSRPGIGVSDPARWQPAYAPTADAGGAQNDQSTAGKAPDAPDYAVFFVHPTSYTSRASWNDSIGDDADAEALRVAKVYIRGMASAFNSASQIWAPRYRQATIGAFMTDKPEAQAAIDAAYADVREAYLYFIESLDADTPIVLAGHSQGSLHLMKLLREEVMPSPVGERLVGAYIIGWPVSVEHDLPAMGLPACATAMQTGCVLSWSSFAEPADPSSLVKAYASSKGMDGQLRGESEILCTNPLTGGFGGSAPANDNLGTLVPDTDMSNGKLMAGLVPARCDDRGILLIGDPPEMGAFVLPGNNYHVYDYPLFWANTQADIVRRVNAKVNGPTAPKPAELKAEPAL